mmetsp:Transcript_29250/g.75017  ORF Transcript_29250/g.75017 Transcript_29250/m.75017 type:complete len:270 (-) Transcript_29250:896-1705(-)
MDSACPVELSFVPLPVPGGVELGMVVTVAEPSSGADVVTEPLSIGPGVGLPNPSPPSLGEDIVVMLPSFSPGTEGVIPGTAPPGVGVVVAEPPPGAEVVPVPSSIGRGVVLPVPSAGLPGEAVVVMIPAFSSVVAGVIPGAPNVCSGRSRLASGAVVCPGEAVTSGDPGGVVGVEGGVRAAVGMGVAGGMEAAVIGLGLVVTAGGALTPVYSHVPAAICKVQAHSWPALFEVHDCPTEVVAEQEAEPMSSALEKLPPLHWGPSFTNITA